jgi:hypothetical protein
VDPLVGPALGEDHHPGVNRTLQALAPLGRLLLIHGDGGVPELAEGGVLPGRLPRVELNELLAERLEHGKVLGERL